MRRVRLATAADVPALVALDTIARHEPGRRAAIAGWVAAGECHVLCDDGAPMGYAALTRGFFHAPCIETLMVAEAARRTGAGRALVAHCVGLVRRTALDLDQQINRPMQALLEGLGFLRSGIVENLDQRPGRSMRLPAALADSEGRGRQRRGCYLKSISSSAAPSATRRSAILHRQC